jgi:hypothetical protein
MKIEKVLFILKSGVVVFSGSSADTAARHLDELENQYPDMI